MTGATVAACARGGAPALVTIGTDGANIFGFNSGLWGSISPNTYKDGGGSTRTIIVLEYNGSGTQIIFQLSGVVTNNDMALRSLVVGGQRLLRSAATYSTDSSTFSQWSWNVGSNILGTSGTKPVRIN